ncbi:MAG: hypothetical protein IT175_18000 [Acidobacteria bacterium]|nr:hypothetical protein [Acidobacteriota bacterium]
MKKRLALPLRSRLTRHQGQTVLRIELEREAVAEWCLGLCLLKEGLISILLVQEVAARGMLEVQLGTQRTRSLASLDPSASKVSLTQNDLDYIQHFFLKYFRDGVADVDHIDLDVVSDTDSQQSTITFKVPDSIGPVSAEEARKRLGLN